MVTSNFEAFVLTCVLHDYCSTNFPMIAPTTTGFVNMKGFYLAFFEHAIAVKPGLLAWGGHWAADAEKITFHHFPLPFPSSAPPPPPWPQQEDKEGKRLGGGIFDLEWVSVLCNPVASYNL